MAPGTRLVLLVLLALLAACASTAQRGASTSTSTSNQRVGGGQGLVRPAVPRWLALQRTAASDGGVVGTGTGTGTDAGADAGSVSSVALHARADASVPLPRCPDSAVYIPAGTFRMGSAEGTGSADEHPAHPVTLRAYCLDRLEATVDAYTRCVTARACIPASGAQPVGVHPVSGIDWEQASSFCRYLGGRLPSEAEWEFAARGTDGRRYPWGDPAPTDCTLLDWTPRESSCNGVGPSPVGSFPPGASPAGLLDMAGNVWEWTADWYTTAYDPGPQTDPTGPQNGSARVTRGGGWNNDQTDRVSATFRQGEHPAFHDYDLGVRCAYDTPP